MAQSRCHHHRPEGPHYRTYAQPLAHLELPCSEEGCSQQTSIWLNPEEVNDYERGSRRFYDFNFEHIEVDSRGLSTANPDYLKRLRINLQFLRKARNAKIAPKIQRKLKT